MLVQKEDAYLNFVNSIKSDVTKKIYEYNLRLFMEFCGINNFENLIGRQDQIIPYLMSLREKKLDPEFEREYNLKYLGKVGNVFSPTQIDECIRLGNELKDIPISQYTLKCCGLDPGFSSSKTAIVLTEHIKDQDKIIVRYSEEIDKGDPNAICDKLFDFHRKYWNLYLLIDGSNRAMVNLLKIKFGESLDWDPKDVSPEIMKVLPVNFNTEHKQMLSHLHVMISKGYLAIPSEHDKVITSLHTAYANELSLDKEQTSYDDLLDALRLALKGYNIG